MLYTIFTLGCKVNTYESEAIRELFALEKYQEADAEQVPDIVIINTCVVTSVATKKSRQHIRKFRLIYPHAILIVMGCYSQQVGDAFLAQCDADIIVGTSNRHLLIKHIDAFLLNKQKIINIEGNPRHFVYEEIATLMQPYNSRAFVKIQDGCDNFCSYCIIPYVRGRSRSRKPENIIQEIQKLVANGYKEIVITGIHTGGYGKDLKEYTFSRLIEEILTNVPDLYRLRISSLEASEIDSHFIALLKKYSNIANHLHIPLQSGSPSVLRRMNRRYNVEDFLKTVTKIRQVRPDIALTTDVIVGFPGESEKEFDETTKIIDEVHFSQLHVFPFSRRENTQAFTLPDQVDEATKKRRVHLLLELSLKLHRQYSAQYIGQPLEILFEDYNQKTKTYRGHSSNYLEVHHFNDDNLCGKIKTIIYQG